MKEPIVVINGVSTERDKEIKYTGNSIVDSEILKTKIMIKLVQYTQNRIPFGLISYPIDSIPNEVYERVNSSNDSTIITALVNMLFYRLQYNGVYIKWDDLFCIISDNVNYNSTQNHQ